MSNNRKMVFRKQLSNYFRELSTRVYAKLGSSSRQNNYSHWFMLTCPIGTLPSKGWVMWFKHCTREIQVVSMIVGGFNVYLIGPYLTLHKRTWLWTNININTRHSKPLKSKFVHLFVAFLREFEQIICKSIFRTISKKSSR